MKETKLVVIQGQYEEEAIIVTVRHKTERGLQRRINQLKKEYAVYGDNWSGWISARVAYANEKDSWGDNMIIGGQWCDPYLGWIEE